MPSKRPSLADVTHRLRQQMANLPGQWRAWRTDLRGDPGLLWRSSVLRIAGFVLLIVVALIAIDWLVTALTPGGAQGSRETATPLATLYVACADPECRAHYTVQKPMDFDDWPLTCNQCGQKTIYRAQRCPVCGHWCALPAGQSLECPFCAEKQAAQKPPEPTHREQRPRSDDDEDPW